MSEIKKQVQEKREMVSSELKNRGVEIDLPKSYDELEEKSVVAIEKVLSSYPKALKMWRTLCRDEEVRANWDMADFIAVTKLHYNDHGEVHAKVAAASAVSMLDILIDSGIEPEIVTSGAGDEDDAFLAVMTASLCHDFGNQVHRVNHGDMSVYLSLPILNRLLPQIYGDVEKRTEIRGFILSAIHTHDGEPEPLTIEAGLVCVGDATDMTKGRGRMAFDLGNINIHSVSALSIDSVSIARGRSKPIEIYVQMSNSAGIFQVQETLGEKVAVSPLSDFIDVIATTEPIEGEYERRIVYGIQMKGKNFVPYTKGR